MTFLAPWAAGFLVGLPVIVLLYLLKLKRRPLTVSTLLFWERVLQENRRRALFQKLRHLLSLLLHLLIFLLIVAALAKPTFDRLIREGASVFLLIDTRARMRALEADGKSRFDRAMEQARSLVREASPARQMALLTVGATPAVAVPFTGDERALMKGLAEVAASDATGDLEAAFTLADSLVASRKGDARMILLTDRPDETPRANADGRLSVMAFGTPHDNVAITRFATRPLLNSPQTSDVLLEMKNFGRTKAAGNVEIAFDGRLLDVKPYALAPGEQRLELFPSVPRTTRTARGWLTARLDTPDAQPSDNIAFTVLATPQPHRVLLISKGNWFVEKLLAADRQVQFELLAPDAWQPDLATKFDVVIFDNFVPTGFALGTNPGNFLFLNQSPFASSADPVEQPLITDVNAEHPALRLVNLQNVTIVRAAATSLPANADDWTWEAPLRSFEHPLLLTGTRSNQRVAALAFDVADSDLPLRVAFPLLMANTVHWLAGETATIGNSVPAGERLNLNVGASISTLPVTDVTSDLAAVPRVQRLFQPLRNGFYAVHEKAGARWLAVNTFSDVESDLRGTGSSSPTAPAFPAVSLATVGGWPLWRYLALAALLLITAEWWLFHRRRTE